MHHIGICGSLGSLFLCFLLLSLVYIVFWIPEIICLFPHIFYILVLVSQLLVSVQTERFDERLQFGPELIDGSFGIIIIIQFEIVYICH